MPSNTGHKAAARETTKSGKGQFFAIPSCCEKAERSREPNDASQQDDSNF